MTRVIALLEYFTLDLVCVTLCRWLNKSVRHVVHLNLFMVGFEHVILGICEKFGTKVAVCMCVCLCVCVRACVCVDV